MAAKVYSHSENVLGYALIESSGYAMPNHHHTHCMLAHGGQSSGLCWAGLGCKLWDEGRALSTSLLLTGHSLRHVLLK